MEPELVARYTPVYDLDAQGNPVGVPVEDRDTPERPAGVLTGRHVRLEPLNAQAHTADLFAAFVGHDHLWTYMPHGPFPTEDSYREWVLSREGGADPYFYAIIEQGTGMAIGVASYLRIDPPARSIEVGWITYSPQLQKSRLATEAMYLMMNNAFDLGYRRYEWKCNALNTQSRNAALRLGMTYEGTFRQATVVKGRNRDTAWFSILDSEWPSMRSNFDQWLQDSNFDAQGNQLSSLSR
ncbi:MAG: GNAT family N-acetyltransferase [Candidatus Nanopelagicales bacterium]|nr:GNAT family N-acetyltransferase [Candidatus Nanopelagicales bacterium]MCF8539749.1 GNAT family N-acetyltransferase [Candidatus Nanopelagicales bacterium]MCF8551303.1 GNAT family N-acetyltransferase [Candidatus Nanopelagicales bacterium]